VLLLSGAVCLLMLSAAATAASHLGLPKLCRCALRGLGRVFAAVG